MKDKETLAIEGSNPKERESKEVWLSYRSKGTNDVRRMLVPGKVANRYLKKLQPSSRFIWDIVTPAASKRRLNRVAPSSRVDFLRVDGVYEGEIVKKALKEAKIHLQVAQSRNYQQEKLREIAEQEAKEALANKILRGGRTSTQRMSFHVGRLDQSVIVLCPITGIVGKLEMPYCPVALSYEHPLAKPGNVLTFLRYHFSLQGQQADLAYLKNEARLKVDRQTMAGCLLSLLRGKHLLKEDGETTAAERNMVLQNAGYDILASLCKEMVRVWDNYQVWSKMPKLSVEWKTHSGTESTIGFALGNYYKIMKAVLDPTSELSKEEQAKLFAVNRPQSTKAKGIRVYSASAVEFRKIKETKGEASTLLDELTPHMKLVDRLFVSKIVRQLLIMPLDQKLKASRLLRGLFIGRPQAAVAKELANMIERASNESILGELQTLSMEVSPMPNKSLADILAVKKAKKEDKENQGE